MLPEQGGKRVAGIRFGAPGSMRVLEALGCAGLTLRAFSNADLRAVLVERLGTPADEVTPGHIGYQLRKLRGKGLVRKVKGRNLYTLTDLGYRVTIYFTKLHQRLLTPGLNTFDTTFATPPAASTHPIDRALQSLNTKFDTLARLCRLEIAA